MAEDQNTNPQAPKVPPPPQLKKFVFESDRFTGEVVPRHLDPVAVAEFLNEKINEKTPLKPLVQAEKAAAFYDVYEIAGKYRSLINTLEPSDDVLLRRIVLDRTIAKVGTPDDVAAAKQVYESIAARVQSIPEFKEAILLHDVLEIGTSSPTLRNTLRAKLTALAPQSESDGPGRLEYLELQETVSQKLEDAEKAADVKASILGKGSRKQRMDEEIKAYLAVGYGYIEFLQPWAAMRLRRETWAANPDEQTTRPQEPPLKKEVAEAFRDFLGKIDTLPGHDDDDKNAVRVQVLRAIKFFGGEISEQDEQFLQQFSGTQADTLANEGFLLP